MLKTSTIAKRVTETRPLPGLRLFTVPTKIKGAVFLTGSFLAGAVHSGKNQLTAIIAADMLDEGTKTHSRKVFRESFDSIGASIDFSADAFRTNFSAHCLKEHVPLVLSLLAEALREPRFGAVELAAAKLRLIASLEQDKENTRSRADARLSQLLYPAQHPNRRLGHDEAIRLIRSTTRADVASFHEDAYGLGSFELVAAGDVSAAAMGREVERAFGSWKQSALPAYDWEVAANVAAAHEETIVVPGKANVDAFFGGPAHIMERDKDFIPLSFGIYVLGGTFFGRLYQSVREEKGLTYGVRASLGGCGNGADGYWSIWSTFAPDLLARGKAAIREELEKWVEGGITEDELATFKETIRGAYTVGLGTAAGFAEAVLNNAEQGRLLSYLDEYLLRMSALSRAEVNQAIRAHVYPDAAIVVAAGAIKA